MLLARASDQTGNYVVFASLFLVKLGNILSGLLQLWGVNWSFIYLYIHPIYTPDVPEVFGATLLLSCSNLSFSEGVSKTSHRHALKSYQQRLM